MSPYSTCTPLPLLLLL
jgi:hypothetical protein